MDQPLIAEPEIESTALVRELLDMNGITKPPTNADAIAKSLGLHIKTFDHVAENLSPQIRAYLWPANSEIGVDRKLSPKRRAFSILHEIGHYVLPGHITNVGDAKITDEDRTLSTISIVTKEIEANQFAADCLFQLERFDHLVYTTEITWKNIQNASDLYETSFEATARRWVERSLEDCALVVFKPESREQAGLPLVVMYTIVSRSFRDNFFSKIIPGQKMSENTLVHRIFHGLEYREDPEEFLQIQITTNNPVNFSMRLFTNSYRMFGLLKPLINQ